MEKRFATGFIVGKFYPPHLGHSYLIDTALSRCDRVVVCVMEKDYGWKVNIPARIRAEWLKELHPKADVTWQKQPDWLPDSDSPGWAAWTLKQFGKPDAVFTSEEYGARWAKHLGCEHVLVDIDRVQFPVSGTDIRRHPFRYWEWMHPVVRAWFVKRVVLLGVESTGKTTLAKVLAKHYKTVCVPEYGRIFYEGFSEIPNAPEKWMPPDLVHIGNIQVEIENWMRRKSGPVMICDTDVFATQLWNWRYYNSFDPTLDKLINKNPADLYLVCGDEIPFTQDGFRYDDQRRRHLQQVQTMAELERRGFKWDSLVGRLKARTRRAITQIDNMIGES